MDSKVPGLCFGDPDHLAGSVGGSDLHPPLSQMLSILARPTCQFEYVSPGLEMLIEVGPDSLSQDPAQRGIGEVAIIVPRQ